MDDSPARGRRGNGLQSADWGALVDLDPRLSEALLASLASAGVAAYVEPALGSNTITRAATLPDRPLDRLWVDPARADSARAVVGAEVADLTTLLAEQDPGATAHGLVQPVPRTAARRVLAPPVLPGPPAVSSPVDPDEEFRRIVEGFGREVDSPVPPWPVSEDLADDPPARRLLGRPGAADRPGADGGADGGDATTRRRRLTDPPADGGADGGDATTRRRRLTDPPAEDGLPDWVEPAAVADEGHYEPPPPPPVPRLAPQKAAAAAALLVGVVLMFGPQLLLQDRTAFVGMLGLLLTAGGAAALVYLMRDAPPTDSGPDDGAVV